MRFNPRDVGEIRVYFNEAFLCRAIAPELAADEISLEQLQTARAQRRHALKQQLRQRRSLTAATAAPVYFCDPHSPWQRGSNENMNGLLRDYFPKGSDLGIHSPKRLAQVAAEINDRPRTVLNWATPSNRFSTLLTNPQ